MLDSNQNMVHLKLFPRIDYSKSIGLPKSEQNASSSRKMFIKPPPKAFHFRAVDEGGKIKIMENSQSLREIGAKMDLFTKFSPLTPLCRGTKNAELPSQTSKFEIGDNVEVINHV